MTLWCRFVGFGLLSLTGCGAWVSGTNLVAAETHLHAAAGQGALDKALYDYTKAQLYLHKAKEEDGYAHYAAAVRYARMAAEYAQAAGDKAQRAPSASGPLCDPNMVLPPMARPAGHK